MEQLTSFLLNKRTTFILFLLFAILASSLAIVAGAKQYTENDASVYNHYNNYTIFKQSAFHLYNHKDLYISHPKEQFDLFKYTPTFAAFFGLLAYLPDWLGLNIWNILNALVLFFGIYYLPNVSLKKKAIVSYIVIFELLTSLQNHQSNGLMVGSLVLAFGLLERKHYLWATLLIVVSVYIKLFGIIGFTLFIFYPKKGKLIAYTILWSLLLFLVPLFFVSWEEYILLFKSYAKMLSEDHSNSFGLSVMGWLETWFGLVLNKTVLVLIGVLIFLLPLLHYKYYNNYIFRLLFLSSILIWSVIFNHKAESPTFVIAMTGVAIWYLVSEWNLVNKLLLWVAIIFTGFSATDLFPPVIRHSVFQPYVVKVVPCILIWLLISYTLIRIKSSDYTRNLES